MGKKRIWRVFEIFERYNDWGWRNFLVDFYEYYFRFKYKKYTAGQLAMEKMVKDYTFDTVLDIGSGDGAASKFFREHGKTVTANDFGESVHFEDNGISNVIIGDYNKLSFEQKFDAIWCSHCLEHQLNVQLFLEKINDDLKRGGYWRLPYHDTKKRRLGVMYRYGHRGC